MTGTRIRRFRLFLLAAAVAFSVIGVAARPAAAHNDDCIVAVHVGGTQVHPACG